MTELSLVRRPLTRTSSVLLSPKLVRETASDASASRNHAQFRWASTCSESARVCRSMTITLTRTARASATSMVRRSPYRR